MLFVFFFNDTATTEIYTLSLHDALPIWLAPPALVRGFSFGTRAGGAARFLGLVAAAGHPQGQEFRQDRKSTRLNSSHQIISYAVFCLKKKNYKTTTMPKLTTSHRLLHHL